MSDMSQLCDFVQHTLPFMWLLLCNQRTCECNDVIISANGIMVMVEQIKEKSSVVKEDTSSYVSSS